MTATTAAGVRTAGALSNLPSAADAVATAATQALAELGTTPDLAVFFVSHHYRDAFEQLGPVLAAQLGGGTIVGCTGESIVGGDQEIEQQPAFSLWLASLPNCHVRARYLTAAGEADQVEFAGWSPDFVTDSESAAAMIVLGEPFSFPADRLLPLINAARPGLPVVGGMASGAWEAGENVIWLGERCYNNGGVAVVLDGPVPVRTAVSQGCRPIGRHFIITKAEQNIIFELSGRPALERLQEVYAELTPEDQQLVRKGLHVGQVLNEYQDQFRRGDFLIRNVIGSSPDKGAIAVGDFVRIGRTVQFHVRDAVTADEDLRELLTRAQGQGTAKPAGGLLFTCNGRGTRLFPQPHHDASVVQDLLGPLPLAGFFAQGEIGPVAGKNHLHGFTASVLLIG